MPPTFRTFGLKDFDRDARTVRVVASTRNPGASMAVVQREGKDVEVPAWDRIVRWDLERYQKAPRVLWAHSRDEFPIGRLEGIEWNEETGELSGTVKFATVAANPKAEQVMRNVEERNVEGLSVGFREGKVLAQEERDGALHRDIAAELLEVSFVPVGEDEDALTTTAKAAADAPEAPEPEAGQRCADDETKRRAALSEAGRALAAGRRPKLDAGEVQRLDFGRLDFRAGGNVQVTGAAGVRIPATLTRVGVLEYRHGDGTISRELRPPEEVFHADSVASLRSLPVTDNHPYADGGRVDPMTWRRRAVGHVEDPAADGERYLTGQVVINDADAINAIDRGERSDISAGYVCKYDRSHGVWNGQAYDLIQRRIRYNHVAILPPGAGRAGTDVGLRLDATDAVCVTDTQGAIPMPKIIVLDGKDYEYGSEQHIGKLEAMHLADLEKAEADSKAAAAERDELRGKLDALEADQKRLDAKKAADEEAAKKGEEEEKAARKAAFKKKMRLALRAAQIMEDEMDDAKMDSLFDSDRELMVACIQKTDSAFTGEGESDDYVRARFDMTEKTVQRADSVDGVVDAVEKAKGAAQVNEHAKARAEMIERNRNAWKTE